MIELLVTISIIVIVFSIGIANYRDFSRREALNGISKQIKADLRTAQQLSLSGKKPESASCSVLDGYRFSLNGQNGYKLEAICNNSGVTSLVEHKVVDLGEDITISLVSPTVEFKVLGQGTNLETTNIITLTHTGGNQTTVRIGVGGDVE